MPPRFEVFMKKRVSSDRQFLRSLLSLALPLAFQSLMLASVAAADAFMLGSIEQDSMSAVSLASQVQFVQNIILSSVAGTVVILGAQYHGKGDEEAMNEIFCISLRLNAAASFLFFCACEFLPRSVMLLFTDAEPLLAIGVRYLRIAGWSYLITGFSQCYLAVMKVSDHARTAALISSGTVVLNIVLNGVLIFGLFGAPRLEERGAAIATLIARVVEFALAVFFSLRPGYIRPRISRLFHTGKDITADFKRLTLPILGAGLLWGVGFTSYSAFMGHLGPDTAAANSVVSVVRELICCACNGIAAGGGILVGNELGAGRIEQGKEYGDRIFRLAFLCGLLSCLLMLALTPLLPRLVRLTGEASRLLEGMMAIMAVYIIGRCVNTILINGIFDSGGDAEFDVKSLAVTMWLVAVPLAALGTFVFHWHPYIVFSCTCLDEVGKIPWVVVRYRKYIWAKNLTR